MVVIVLSAPFFIVAGLACLYARDMLWEFAESRYRRQGIVSERTPEWESRTKVSGVLGIIFGVAVLLLYTFG